MFREIIAFLSPVTLYRPSRVPQWAHTGVAERAMSLITGVAVTWVPSAKTACLTAVPSGSQCKCEVTPWHLGIHAHEKCHGLHAPMHCKHTHIFIWSHTHVDPFLLTHTFSFFPPFFGHKHSTQSSNSCQSALTPSWEEHAVIRGVLIIILLRLFWLIRWELWKKNWKFKWQDFWEWS